MPTDYSRAKLPPAPILQIKLSQPNQSAQTDTLPALIDTGSDFTLVPLSWLLRIDAPESRSAFVRGLWSEPHQVTLYWTDLHLDLGVLAGVEVIGVSEDEVKGANDSEILLGRNVLNKLILLLDGPREQIDVLERRPVKL